MASPSTVLSLAAVLCMLGSFFVSSVGIDGDGEHDCTNQCSPNMLQKSGSALLQVKRKVGATPSLEVDEVNAARYSDALKQKSTQQVANAIEAIVEKLDGVVVNREELFVFSSNRSLNTVGEHETAAQSLELLVQALQEVSAAKGAFLRLPPPEKGALLWKMIRPDPWNCDLVWKGDPRYATCKLEMAEGLTSENFEPKTMSCSKGKTCMIEHANAYRTLQKIGALPCCPTSPFCAAPACAERAELSTRPPTCTKRSSQENLAYLKDPDVWPAYHGFGGAMELDTLKLIDLLGCHGKTCTEEPFDLMLDLGANTGYYTEKLTVRSFAKNYIMIEANPETKEILQKRWGDETWKQVWFTQQVTKGGRAPDFEVINQALSNHSKGILDMCETEKSMVHGTNGKCKVSIASIDDLVPSKLTPVFQEHVKQAQSAFIKIDTEGMDELVLRGMSHLLDETRGQHADGSPRHLVNFLQFEFSPYLMQVAKEREGFQQYDIKSVTQFLESIGFETFLIGPRYLPLSHGSWDDEFLAFTNDPNNNAGVRVNYPNFDDRLCSSCATEKEESFTGDIFAIRASHPRLSELKLALGVCQESKDFHMKDPQYTFVELED